MSILVLPKKATGDAAGCVMVDVGTGERGKDDGDAIVDNYLLEESENESRPVEKGVVLADENAGRAVGNEGRPRDLSASGRRKAVESAHSVWRSHIW
ncbi:hypothetical protein PS1_031043 [Malus domestica]